MPISKDKTRTLITIEKDLLAWVDAQATKENRDRTNYIITLIKREKEKLTKGESKMTKTNWKALIEENREELEKAIFEQWKNMLDEPVTTSMRSVVLLWDDGEVTTGYRDQNSFSRGEHDGTAICIASFGSQMDDCHKDFDSAKEYIGFMSREYPVDVDEIIDRAIIEL